MSCPLHKDDQTFEEYFSPILIRWNIVEISIFIINSIIIATSVIMLCQSKRRKNVPIFVIKIYSCLIASELLLILQAILIFLDIEGDIAESQYDLFWRLDNYILGIVSASNSLAHWIFAMEYFKVALRFPIIIDLFQAKVNEKITLTDRIIKYLNISYYFLIIVWIILVLAIQFPDN